MKDIYVPFQPALLSSGLKSLGLSMRECRPSNILSNIVHSYVSMDVEKPVHYPIMPDGTVSIFVFPGETLIRGPFSHPINPYIDAAGNYFGIRFYPAGLRFLFRNNFEEISHQVVDSRFFECKVFDSIHQRIYDSNSWQEQISIMETWLLSHWEAASDDRIGHALSLIYQNQGMDRVSALADETGVTSRHLNRLFRHYTGLSTKGFSQIVRIQEACRRLMLQPEDGTSIALSLNFTDQAHMLREFHRHYGASPSDLRRCFMSDFYNT